MWGGAKEKAKGYTRAQLDDGKGGRKEDDLPVREAVGTEKRRDTVAERPFVHCRGDHRLERGR